MEYSNNPLKNHCGLCENEGTTLTLAKPYARLCRMVKSAAQQGRS